MIEKTERLSLFCSSAVVEIPMHKWNSLWLFVDNVWRIESRKTKKWKLVCKLLKTADVPNRKTILKSNLCSASATVMFKENDVVLFEIHPAHCHTLDLADSYRRSTFIHDFVKEEISRGYDAGSVITLVKKKALAHDHMGFKYVTTSHPVESFFSLVKKVVNVKMSFEEATCEIVQLLQGLFDELNEQKEKETVSLVVGVENIHSSVASWKLSYQRLILKEFENAQKYIAEGLLDSLFIQAQQDGTCRCKFYRLHQMPCSHILGRHLVSAGGFISEEHWKLLNERFQ